MHLPDVSRPEPPPAILVEELLPGFLRKFVVPLADVGSADNNLSSGVRPVGDAVFSLVPVDEADVAGCGRVAGSSKAHISL